MSRIEYGSAKGYDVPDRRPDFEVEEWIFYIEEGIQTWTTSRGTLQGWKIVSDGKQLFWINSSGEEAKYECDQGDFQDDVAEEYRKYLNDYMAEKIILGEI